MGIIKRFFIISLAFLMLITYYPVLSVDAQGSYSEGSLLKIKGSSTVYYIGPDAKKYVFPEAKTYNSWYDNFSKVKEVSSSELDKYPDGGVMPIKGGVKLITHSNTSKVYAVEAGGILRHIPSEKVAKELFGDDWYKKVVDVIPGFFSSTYRIGEELSDTLPNGYLITYGSKYYYIENGKKRLMTKEALKLNNFKEDDAIRVRSLSKYKDDDSISKQKNSLTNFVPPIKELGEDKVVICHNNNNLRISKNALAAHLKIGDTQGACKASTINEDQEVEDIIPGQWCSVLLGLFNGHSSSTHELLDLNNDGVVNLSDNSMVVDLYNSGNNAACLGHIEGNYNSNNYQNLDWCNSLVQGISDSIGDTSPFGPFDLYEDSKINLSDVSMVATYFYEADQAQCYSEYVPLLPAMTSGGTVDNDFDNDGYNTLTSGGTDCDDSSASINPGATEVLGNNIDDNCNNQIDEVSTPPATDNQEPTIPTNLTTSISGTQVSLNWTASTDNVAVTGYQILRSTTNGSAYTQVATSNSTSYNDASLLAGTYYYVVRAYDAAGNTSANSNQATATINSISGTCEATGSAHCYYISPSGSDSNNGSINSPFASTNPIINTIAPGDYIYFRGGSYGPAAKGQIANYAPWLPRYYSIAYVRRSGTANNPITFKAYPGESPIFDMYNINPEFDQNEASDPISDPVSSPDSAFTLYHADNIVISGFEIIHGSILAYGSDYTWVEDNHIHDLLSDRDNNGLVILYFTKHAYVRNNDLHDTYQRSISNGSGGWVVNNVKSHTDAQHNGCITTLSGDTYEGYGVESSGPFEFTDNKIHDCPVHLFIKNPQGQLVNSDGINMLIKDNYFYGAGHLAEWFQASNVVFENNLFKGIDGISGMGGGEATGDREMLNEITARNVTFKNNVFTSASYVVKMPGLGFRVANGVYSTALEDKFKFYNNIVVMGSDASASGTMGWNQPGYVFGNAYFGQIDPQSSPSKTLSRIDSTNNCFINSRGVNLAFLKHWLNGSQSITGYSHSEAQTMYNINGSGDLFPSDTSLVNNFTNPNSNNFSVKSGSACASILNIGLSNPGIFTN